MVVPKRKAEINVHNSMRTINPGALSVALGCFQSYTSLRHGDVMCCDLHMLTFKTSSMNSMCLVQINSVSEQVSTFPTTESKCTVLTHA